MTDEHVLNLFQKANSTQKCSLDYIFRFTLLLLVLVNAIDYVQTLYI